MNSVTTFLADIWIGTIEGYDGPSHSIDEIETICQDYVNDVGLCVTVTPTSFVYTNGRENGARVGLINYPRFPSTPEAIKFHAFELAARLKHQLKQIRCTVVCSDETVMIGEKD